MDQRNHSKALARLKAAGSALVSDAMGRFDGIIGFVRYDSGDAPLVGIARTVQARAGDNLALYAALANAAEGEILVVDAGGCSERAVAGDLLRSYAAMRGVRGFVIDGAVRDTAVFRDGTDFGCFARSASHRGPFKDGPGRLGIPVAIAGHIVSPGDILVADSDGIVSFPAEQLTDMVDRVVARQSAEDAIRAEIANGKPEQSWIEAAMAQAGSRIS